MVIAHEVANQNSTIDNEVAYMKANWQNAFVHYYVSDNKIVETANPNYLAYGAGPKANPYALHVELVRNNGKNFQKAYENYVWLIVYLCHKYKIPVRFNKNRKGIVTHHWVSQNLGGTDHSDPDAWLRTNKVSLKQFEKDLLQLDTGEDMDYKKKYQDLKKKYDKIRKERNSFLSTLVKIKKLFKKGK